jgi:ParB-like chromosome segregation protein Spo0J
MIKTIKISDIVVLNRKRPLDQKTVQSLADSIKIGSLINNITVSPSNELIAGYHRLEALKLLGYDEVEVNVIDVSDLDKELLEIDENLIRKELTALEHSEQLLRRKQIYEIKYPETKKGVAQALGMNKSKKEKNVSADSAVTSKSTALVKSFVKDTAEKTGSSERTIQENIQIATNISPETKAVIKDSVISNKKTKLVELAQTPENEQLQKALQMIKEEIESNEEFKKVKKKKIPFNRTTEISIENMIEKLEIEISEKKIDAVNTFNKIHSQINKQRDFQNLLSEYQPHLIEIIVNNFNLDLVKDLIKFEYNPFLLPKLFDEKQEIVIKQIQKKIDLISKENYLRGTPSANGKKILNYKRALEMIKDNNFEEVCNLLYTMHIYVNE